MPNIIDYIKKYGDCEYSELPFNDVDSLILSQFSYLKFDGLVPQVGQNLPPITIANLSKMPDVDNLFSDERYAKVNRSFFEALATHRRFSFIRLNYYINLVDEKWEMQFSAITCLLPNDHVHVVFRGTDESIIGWKEDLNMAFMSSIPAQEKALDYLNYVSALIEGDFTVGGHSKGGNLAVYAAMMCSSDIRERITEIHSHDGPGFSRKVIRGDEFERIRQKVRKFVPHSSIVGMLLQTQEDYEIVACRNFGLLQHDPFNWIVEGCDFVKRDDLTEHIMLGNDSINAWAQSMSDEELMAFADQLYDVFERAQITDLNEFYRAPAATMKRFLEAAEQIDDKNRKMLREMGRNLAECFKDQVALRKNTAESDEPDKTDRTDT